MNLIEKTFDECKKDRRAAFIAYIAAGDPDFDTSMKIVESLIEAGVDIIELGVPFSDPLADGEANQLAAERALASGMTSFKVLEMACEIRRNYPDFPLVLFTYMNPIAYAESADFADFCKKAVDSGINAILPLDLPPEEMNSESSPGVSYKDAMDNAGLSNVILIAPTTPEQRFSELAGIADAFIYYVSREGVTGEGNSFSAEFADRIAAIKNVTDLPVVVGFGISTPEHVKTAAATGVDGVVVGSAIVRRIEALSQGKETLEGIREFVSSLTAVCR
jgi:tryptophan synthase alpha chain